MHQHCAVYLSYFICPVLWHRQSNKSGPEPPAKEAVSKDSDQQLVCQSVRQGCQFLIGYSVTRSICTLFSSLNQTVQHSPHGCTLLRFSRSSLTFLPVLSPRCVFFRPEGFESSLCLVDFNTVLIFDTPVSSHF